jgi:hypothetical protein
MIRILAQAPQRYNMEQLAGMRIFSRAAVSNFRLSPLPDTASASGINPYPLRKYGSPLCRAGVEWGPHMEGL